jgi:hypothetical protein
MDMKPTCLLRATVFAVLLTLFLLPSAAHAANVTVGCPGGSGGTYPSISAALAAIGQTGPSTITVTGTCQENVSLYNARSITIAAPTPGGAAIVGPLDTDTFDIDLSQDINLVNLDISGTFSNTGNGGGGGVVVTEASDVHIMSCTIHDNQAVGVDADTGSILFMSDTIIQNNTPNDGLDVTDNSTADVIRTTIQKNGSPGPIGGSGVFLTGASVIVFRQTNLIQNNSDNGIAAVNLSQVRFQSGVPGRVTTIQGHNVNGIILRKQSHLQLNGTSPHVIQRNGIGSTCPSDPNCGGIIADANSTVHITNGTVTGNQGPGISAQQGSNIRLEGATVSNNSGDGVRMQWISVGYFGSGNSILNNGGASVFCDDDSMAIGNLTGFSKVICKDIDQLNGAEHGERDRDRHR